MVFKSNLLTICFFPSLFFLIRLGGIFHFGKRLDLTHVVTFLFAMRVSFSNSFSISYVSFLGVSVYLCVCCVCVELKVADRA